MKIFSSIQPSASFETNPASICSKMVECGVFERVIVLPEYVLAKFLAEWQVFFPLFFGI